MDEPAVSVVVIAYRQREPLVECLHACMVAIDRLDANGELIVVDNGGLAPLIGESCPQARLVEPGSNTGFAGGVGYGLRAARGRWVALINDDARVEPDALQALLAAGERSDDIGSVAAQVRFDSEPDRINSAGIAVDRLGVAIERCAGAAVEAASAGREVFGPSAACALYRRAMLDQVGGFDGRFFAYLEDVDVAWRARAAGWRCLYEPAAVAYHRASATSGHASAGKFFLVGRNRVWLLARNATGGQLARALPGILAYDLAYIAYVALTARTLAPLRGRVAGLRSWRARRRETARSRRPVPLDSGGWIGSLRQHRAYRELGPPG